ncbi:MAG: hypothetical protein H0X28_05705 [Solirubrobacterales bacterium]|nr:hypothetical protein [Solirubrobacterales bacterium]
MYHVGFLHTAHAHVEAFSALMADVAPSLTHQHIVSPQLLERAQLMGSTDREVRVGVHAALSELPSLEVRVVVCTCSTIGSVAEDCGRNLDLRVLRVDRPMAEVAVRSAHNIALVAALASTLTPTRNLLQAVAQEANTTVRIVDAPCLDAWASFEAGDEPAFHHRIAAHIDSLDPSFDVAVLAQASMAPAAQLVTNGTRVLTSPRLGVEAACRLTLQES